VHMRKTACCWRRSPGHGSRVVTFFSHLAAVLGFTASSSALGAESGDRSIILATTTSTQDSGLLDVLVPLFERKSGYRVKTVSVGTGQALA
jgi:tungstate transport system substrate-binding protein